MHKEIDLFGSQILFRFQGKSSLKTGFGSLYSLIIVAIISIRLVYIISDVSARRNPIVISSERQVNSPEEFNFESNNFKFAFGLQDPSTSNHYINPAVYNVTVKKTKRTSYFNETTQKIDTNQVTTVIHPNACTDTSFKGSPAESYFLKLSYKDLYCFDPTDGLTIEGDYSQEVFQYFSITIQKCIGPTCADNTVIQQQLSKGNFAIYYSDVLFNPEDKETPFSQYARDLYWMVNQDAPKSVNFYYRNTYIESDFGWVNENIDSQRFAQFSNTEVNYLPSSFTDYAFKVLFRFEKQKENLHKRKYQNVNSIISEIGGFTQTLLAIGFLICTPFSQLELNKRIINSAFQFEDKSDETHNQKSNTSFSSPDIQPPVILQNNAIIGQQNNDLNHPNHLALPIAQIQASSASAILAVPQSATAIQQQNQAGSIVSPQSQQQVLTVPVSSRARIGSAQLSPVICNQNENKFFLSSIIQQKQVRKNSSDPATLAAAVIQNDPKSIPSQQQQQQNKQPPDGQKQISDSKFQKLMNRVRGQITLSVWEYVRFLVWPFGSTREKKKIIDYGIDKLYYHLDVLNVIKKLLEVDKLKRLIMDDDQLRLFECLPKPIIRTADALRGSPNQSIPSTVVVAAAASQQDPPPACQPSDLLYQDVRSDIQKTQAAFTSYQRISEKTTRTVFDQKLLDLMDRHLLQLFEIDLNKNECSFEYPKEDNLKILIQEDAVKCSSPNEVLIPNINTNAYLSTPLQIETDNRLLELSSNVRSQPEEELKKEKKKKSEVKKSPDESVSIQTISVDDEVEYKSATQLPQQHFQHKQFS